MIVDRRTLMIVDCFPYFDKINHKILDLRINLLKDYVDYFIISEANQTHSGEDIEPNLPQRLKNLNIDKSKIIYEQVDLKNIEPSEIDLYNCNGIENITESSIRARTRERLQRDSLLNHLDRFSDNDIFIVSDADEIINPEHINWIANTINNNDLSRRVLKIPLVHLEGRADLRVYVNQQPMSWDKSMFICQKKHLTQSTPTQIRSNIFSGFAVDYLSEDGLKIEDLGWHFSWMGSGEDRLIKTKSFIHNNEIMHNRTKNFSSEDHMNLLASEPEENRMPPSAIKGSILKKYDVDKLPKIILDNDNIRSFLLPNYHAKKYVNYY